MQNARDTLSLAGHKWDGHRGYVAVLWKGRYLSHTPPPRAASTTTHVDTVHIVDMKTLRTLYDCPPKAFSVFSHTLARNN